MNALRALLVLMILALSVYTVEVGIAHGWNLLPVFFGDIAAMTWPGQFNLDFLCLLTFSGLWLAWRHGFTPGGIVLGLCGLVGGTAVLAPYLLVMTFRTRGDLRVLLLGPRRAGV